MNFNRNSAITAIAIPLGLAAIALAYAAGTAHGANLMPSQEKAPASTYEIDQGYWDESGTLLTLIECDNEESINCYGLDKDGYITYIDLDGGYFPYDEATSAE